MRQTLFAKVKLENTRFICPQQEEATCMFSVWPTLYEKTALATPRFSCSQVREAACLFSMQQTVYEKIPLEKTRFICSRGVHDGKSSPLARLVKEVKFTETQ